MINGKWRHSLLDVEVRRGQMSEAIIILWLPLLGLSLEVLGERTWGTGATM